ncbi:MAG: hypothetical protein HY821_04060 [Acidobacteria bacterium]|nr:hypothetical protein [Acidobacteriota bacterium]
MLRRNFLSCFPALTAAPNAKARRYHVCLNTEVLEQNPKLLETVRRAGVDTIWLCGFLYGHWYYTPQKIREWAARIRKAGMGVEVIHVPLGHPGDSLGAKSGEPPLTPPGHWRQGVRLDGTRHWGTSLHAPATEENAAAIGQWKGSGFRTVFLDDDFRLATGPGTIGGCHCDEHWAAFQKKAGPQNREALAADIRARALTPAVRAWVEFQCDELTGCHRRLAAGARDGMQVGVMVMYLGSEKAGIRLTDYGGVPFRVGELMFADRQFDAVKGKTDELFSCLFHRRFVAPGLAYSESTAFPADKLSAANMAAKLCISTICDVRNTMFMSGLTPFPATHWETLGPAMRRQAEIHSRVAGLSPSGPFQHYWGEASRYVGADKPYSLFLALGVPFEAAGEGPREGWTFLSDDDARYRGAARARFVTRAEVGETLPELWAFRRRILPEIGLTPYVEEETPVVCCWYREKSLAVVWNLLPEARAVTVRYGRWNRRVALGALGMELVELGNPEQ